LIKHRKLDAGGWRLEAGGWRLEAVKNALSTDVKSAIAAAEDISFL